MIETKRLIIREMVQSDYDALCGILCDEEVMRASYESAFNLEEAQNWLNRHLKRYEEYGFGLWAVVLKETNEMIGQCGVSLFLVSVICRYSPFITQSGFDRYQLTH
ncbi:GNAT family N-acetyltransferase [Paenibacillus chitinolyticus]|uniref:GNAT family N-acetyltransferase n=1 Tax=Paenibacillus chitinolyticus TaxID=79263 RepID=UPI003555DE00